MGYVKHLFLFSFLVVLGFFGALFLYGNTFSLIDLDVLTSHDYDRPTIVLDSSGKELFRFAREYRKPVLLSHVSPHLIHAFVAAEDRKFFAHRGISWRGIARAILINLRAGRVAQGASTITQQLVKMRFFSNNRTFERKIREQFVALLVEGLYSKEQILEAYMNHVYFGAGAYGVEAAAQKFWNKSSADLTPAEAATLAGIVKSPQGYCPLYNSKRSQERRNVVLSSMQQCGYLSEEAAEEAKKEPVLARGVFVDAAMVSGHVREMIRLQLEQQFGRTALYTEGFSVQTTIDAVMQERAEKTFGEHVSRLRAIKKEIDGSLIILDGQSGGIRVLVGGYDFSDSQFNRAVQAHRQLGSLIKPVVYATAIDELGVSFMDTRIDEPLEAVYGWSPRNVTRRFDGQMSLAHALVVSNNIIPVRLFFEIGARPIIELAKRMGLPGPFEPYPSLALGCTECSPSDVAAMFNAFAQQGVYKKPHIIVWVKNAAGKKVYRFVSEERSALSWKTSSQVLWVLRLIGKRISRLRPRTWIAGDFACKTGTTNQQRSCWFAGATPRYTGVVYLGADTNDSLEGVVYSGRHAMPLLVDALRPFSFAEDRFYHSPELASVKIDAKTGVPIGQGGCHGHEVLVNPSYLEHVS